MIIEFIGPPGAGKTTLMPTVIESLQERKIKAFTKDDAARTFAQRTFVGKAIGRLAPESLRQPLLWHTFYRLSTLYRVKFFLKHPKLIWLVISTQRRRPKSADIRQRKVLFWFFRIVGYYEFLKAYTNPGEALIFDEGFVHRVVQLNASAVEDPNPTQIMSYLDLLPRPDVVIYVQAPHDVCEKRIYERGLWERFHQKDPAEISRFVENACIIVNLTVNHIKNRGWIVIDVDNGTDDLASSEAELRHGMLSEMPVSTHEELKFQTV